MMITSKILTTPFAQLTYLIPAGNFDVQSEKDVTALHVLEHWLLEGGERFVGSDAVFREARRIGGNISATVSRKSFELKLAYYAPLHEDAVRLLNDLIQRARFDVADFPPQLKDVRFELDHDNTVTLLFDKLYQELFDGRYALSGGGDKQSAKELTESDVRPFIKSFKNAQGVWIYAGLNLYQPHVEDINTKTVSQNLIAPTSNTSFQIPRYFEQGKTGLVYLVVDHPEYACFEIEAYLDWMYGSRIKVHRHVLPGSILFAVSYDAPQLTHQVILSSANDYVRSSEDVKRSFRALAAATLVDEYSYAAGASRLAGERWMNPDFETIVQKAIANTPLAE